MIPGFMDSIRTLLGLAAGKEGADLIASVEVIAGKVEICARLLKEIAAEVRQNLLPNATTVYEKLKKRGLIK